MTTTVCLAYTIPGNRLSAAQNLAAISADVVDHGEALALGLKALPPPGPTVIPSGYRNTLPFQAFPAPVLAISPGTAVPGQTVTLKATSQFTQPFGGNRKILIYQNF